MARPKNKREVRLSINVTPEVEIRIRKVADVSGHPEGVIASLALVTGLRMLEQGVLGVNADTITAAAEAIRGNTEQEMHEAISVAQQAEPNRESKRPFKLEIDQSTVEWTGYMAGL